MKNLTQGKYLGINSNELLLNGAILSETVYQESFASDWHTHENSYFAFVMNGGCIEKRKTESVECIPGKLLFYNWEEPHKNVNYQPESKIFNIEFSSTWLSLMDMDGVVAKGTMIVGNPDVKFVLLKILKEYRLKDSSSTVNIESMMVQLLSTFTDNESGTLHMPPWTKRLKEILHDCWQENFSLLELSAILQVHPVTISRYFPKYFNCTLGEYIRKIRIDKSLTLIRTSQENLTDIAYTCGFADQSHFIRTFKNETGILPNFYRAI